MSVSLKEIAVTLVVNTRITSVHLSLRVADKVDVLAAKEKAFFASCKRLKASERNDEYEKVN